MNNIFYCYVINEYSTYIIAKEPKRARELFQENIRGNYKKTAVVVNLYKKNVPEEEGLIKNGSEISKKYNISTKKKERIFCIKNCRCSYMRKNPNDAIGYCMLARCPKKMCVGGNQRLQHKGHIISVKNLHDMGEKTIRKENFI